MSPAHRFSLVAALLAALGGTSASAFQAPPSARLQPDYDSRESSPPVVAKPSADRLAAVQALESTIGSTLRVRWNASGGVRWLHAFGVPIAPATDATAETAARRFLAANLQLFALVEQDLPHLELSFLEPSPDGSTHVGFVHVVEGVRVLRGYVRVDLAADHSVLAAGVGDAVAGLDRAANPALAPTAAVARALELVGLGSVRVPSPDNTAASPLVYRIAELAAPIRAELVWFPVLNDAKLSWRVEVSPPGYPAWYEVIVDAANGALLRRANLMVYLDTQASVFTDNPDRAGRTDQRIYDDAVNVRIDWPSGWLYTNTTAGNNTIVQDDRAGDDEATSGLMAIASPGTPQVFAPPFTADPVVDLDLATVNLFWAINAMHEHFYALGFTETAGNFQTDNFGRGGLGGDAVLGDAQDSADTLFDANPNNDVANNANFATPPDGQPPRMQMYIFNNPAPLRDADLDMDVVFHEFCHGLSTRLVGGRGDAGCLFQGQPGAMGEAWGDFFAGSINDDPIVGEYSTQDFTNGIRTAPMSADSYTYGDLCTVAAQCEVHADGEIWAQALWELRAAFIGAYGFAAGRSRAEQLVIDGMKYSPCMPSFLDMRDAILTADHVRYGGVDFCLIWAVFAQNGMGTLALDETAGDPTMPQQDFTLPAVCTAAGIGEIDWQFDSFTCDAMAQVTVTDTDLALPVSVTITSTAGDSEVVALQAAPGGAPGFVTAPFRIVGVAAPGNVVPGDGIVQAVRGDSLTASYFDATDANQRSDVAQLTCVARVEVAGYRFVSGTCDADTLPDYPGLPGFLDAGESAILEVDLVNREPFPIDAVVVTLASSNPDVTIAPTTVVSVGRLDATIGTHEPVHTVRFLASASTAVVSGDTATLTLGLTGTGIDGPTSTIAWTIDLNRDYQVVARSFTEGFETTSPTVGQWTHVRTRPTPTGDDWRLVTCQAASGTRSYKNGGGDPACGNYSDNQGDPYLASPGLRLQPPGSQAARVRRLAFQHHVQLAVPSDPTGICDAEAVAVLLTNDPSTIDTTDPFALIANTLAFYTVVTLPTTPPLVINDNNTAFELVDLDLTPVPIAIDPTLDVFITWVMAVDYTNQYVGPLCNLFNRQGEGYYLDDVVIEWDEVTSVPQGTVCQGPTCLALAQSQPQAVETCSTADLSAAPSLVIGCAGALEYQWSGGELGAPAGYGPVATVSVTPPQPTHYLLDVRCTSDLSCADSTTALVVPGGSGTIVGNLDNALRATRLPAAVHLDWSFSPVTPRRYNVHEVATRAEVIDVVIAATVPIAQPDDIERFDVPLPSADRFFEVYPRNCSGGSVIP